MGLSFVLNDDFKNYYPNKSTDLITNQLSNQIFESEWDEFEHYDNRNKKYLKENFMSYLKDCFLKIKFIFFGIKRDGSYPDENGKLNNEIRISMIFNKFILNISLLASIFILIKNLKNLNVYKDDFYFFNDCCFRFIASHYCLGNIKTSYWSNKYINYLFVNFSSKKLY